MIYKITLIPIYFLFKKKKKPTVTYFKKIHIVEAVAFGPGLMEQVSII